MNPSEAACDRGKACLYAGDITEAIGWFERALELDPANPRFYWFLVYGCSGAVDGKHLAEMERLNGIGDRLSTAQRINLHFALASVYERLGRYDDAFRELRAGNDLKRSTVDYDGTAPKFIDALGEFFTAPFIESLRGYGNSSDRPIFVFGMPRSGTTLVEQLLAAHPMLVAAGELPVLGRLADELRRTLRGGRSLDQLRDHIRAIGDGYVNATAAAAGAARLTDKTPDNFRYAPLIHVALPKARMIHVRRDRLDTCLSCYTTLFEGSGVPYAYDLGQLASYYAAYERIRQRWRSTLPPDCFIEVDYERLVEDFETEARRLVAFCGLAWDERALAFHEVRRPIRTASSVQARQPLYRSSVGRSRRFAAYVRPLFDASAAGGASPGG